MEGKLRKPTGHELPYQTVQESWEHFAADVLPNASLDQRRAMRNAFFAGASTCFLLMMKSLRTSNRTKSHALAEALFKELDEFMVDEVFLKTIMTEGNA
jgi:hypothetical protein